MFNLKKKSRPRKLLLKKQPSKKLTLKMEAHQLLPRRLLLKKRQLKKLLQQK